MRPIPTGITERAAMSPAGDPGRAAEFQNTINLAFANNFLCEILGYSPTSRSRDDAVDWHRVCDSLFP